jgi:hypothetical protein
MSLLHVMPLPVETQASELQDALIELFFAGNALVRLIVPPNSHVCVCGVLTGDETKSTSHDDRCPIARFYSAVEAARRAAEQ